MAIRSLHPEGNPPQRFHLTLKSGDPQVPRSAAPKRVARPSPHYSVPRVRAVTNRPPASLISGFPIGNCTLFSEAQTLCYNPVSDECGSRVR